METLVIQHTHDDTGEVSYWRGWRLGWTINIWEAMVFPHKWLADKYFLNSMRLTSQQHATRAIPLPIEITFK